MKKYGLITIHKAINHGAVLQALATQKAFSKCSCSVTIINYSPPYIREDAKSIRRDKGAAVRVLDFFSGRKKKVENFFRFIENNLSLTEEMYTSQEIAEHAILYDGFISGSDQIWNPQVTGGILETAYFCDFAKRGKNVISYASSLGDRICFSEDQQETIQAQLTRFSHISVREKSGAEWLKEKFNINAEEVVDPTLLLDEKDWEPFIEQSKLKIESPYIFVYSVGRTKELIEYALQVQKALGFKIIVSNSIIKYPHKNVKYINEDSPEDFLMLIAKAAFVITSSYHGTLFSVNFNVPFLSLPASNITSNRSSEILDAIGLGERFITYDTEFSPAMLQIDWSVVNNRINRLRDKSYRYIKNSIGDKDD